MIFDHAEMAEQRLGEGLRVGVAAEKGDRIQRGAGRRQGLGLVVVHHLQTMLDMAQIAIGGDHFLAGGGLDPSRRNQRADRIAGFRLPQPGIAPAPDQLLGLGEEFDFADPAAAELDVVPAHGDLAVTLHGVDLALDRVNVLDGGEVEMAPPDERPQMLQEVGARIRIAGDRARLDHRRALPILPHALVIGFGRQHRHGERRRAGIRPQPEVGAEDIAVFAVVLQQAYQIAGQPHEAVLQAALSAVVDLVAVIKHDQVDIAGVVQLARPQLAHAEDDEARTLARAFHVRQNQIARHGRAMQQMIGGKPQRRIGELREPVRHLLDRPQSGDVGEGDQQCHAPPGAAQAFRHRAGLAGGDGFRLQPIQEIGQDSGRFLG